MPLPATQVPVADARDARDGCGEGVTPPERRAVRPGPFRRAYRCRCRCRRRLRLRLRLRNWNRNRAPRAAKNLLGRSPELAQHDRDRPAEPLGKRAREQCRGRYAVLSAEHASERLVGAPPGYLCHDAGGELTNAVRKRPFSLNSLR